MPGFLKSGQISIGPTKGYYCTGDGEVREFNKGGGGVPVYGKDFTYTGEYQIIDDSDDTEVNWRIKFLTSGILVFSNSANVDLFLVGGGGGGFYESTKSGDHLVGGGGGYTKTEKSLYLEKSKSYEIVVGAGSNASSRDGTTSGFNITAYGGYGGNTNTFSDTAGDGGSGGAELLNPGTSILLGGRNGAGGYAKGAGSWASRQGQGTTTYEYEDSSLELYSNGGDSALYASGVLPGRDYHGDGGGVSDSTTYPGTSGIVIIRNHRE